MSSTLVTGESKWEDGKSGYDRGRRGEGGGGHQERGQEIPSPADRTRTKEQVLYLTKVTHRHIKQ